MPPTLFLVTWFVLPILLWGTVIIARLRLGRLFGLVLSLASIALGVYLLANYVWALDAHLLAETEKHEPGTKEAERAAKAWASDTDRSFLLLASPVLTFFWCEILYSILFLLQWGFAKLMPPDQRVNSGDIPDHAPKDHRDDDNPYQSS